MASLRPRPEDLPRLDTDGDCDDIMATKGAIEGGTLRRRQQQQREKQQRQKEQQQQNQQTEEGTEDPDEGQEAPLAETEVCITPPEGGDVISL